MEERTRLMLMVLMFGIVLSTSRVYGTPSDLSCDTVVIRNTKPLQDCHVDVTNTSNIHCTSYISSNPKIRNNFMIQLKSVYSIKPVQEPVYINQIQYQHCLSVHSVTLTRKENILSDDVPNIFEGPSTVIRLFEDIISNFTIHVNFNSDVTVAFLALNPGCDLKKHRLNTSCISTIQAKTFIVAPIEFIDFDLHDYVQGMIKTFYFTTLKAQVSFAKVSMNDGPEIRRFVPYLRDIELIHLDISNNDQFGSFENMLEGFNDLLYLNLSNSSITAINEQNFLKGLHNLKELNLSRNHLTETPLKIETLSELEVLDMSLQSPENTFDLKKSLRNLTKLQVLNISHLSLSEISRNSLPNTSQLKVLDLSYCNIRTIPQDLFQDLKGLRRIILDGNPLTQLFQNTFKGLTPSTEVYMRHIDLSKLNLKNHPVTIIHDGVIASSALCIVSCLLSMSISLSILSHF